MYGSLRDPIILGLACSDHCSPGAPCSFFPGRKWSWTCLWKDHAQHHTPGSAGTGAALLGIWGSSVPGSGAASRAAGSEENGSWPRPVSEGPSLCEPEEPGGFHQGGLAELVRVESCSGCCFQTCISEDRVGPATSLGVQGRS